MAISTVTVGGKITAATQNAIINATNTLSNYAVMTYADAAARLAALPAPGVGMKSLLLSDNIIYRYDGTTWKAWESDWISYTPTLTGITIGTSGQLNTAEWRYSSGRVLVRGRAKLGASGFSVSGTITVSNPVNRAALNYSWQGYKGTATFYDDSAAINYTAFIAANASSVSGVALFNPGTNGVRSASSASTPFTWAASDMISYDYEYDPA